MRKLLILLLLSLSLPVMAYDDDIPSVGESLGSQAAAVFESMQKLQQAKEHDRRLYQALRAALWLCQDCAQRQELQKTYNNALSSKDIWFANQRLSGYRRNAYNPSFMDQLIGDHSDGPLPPRCKGLFEKWADCLKKDTHGGRDIILGGGSTRYAQAMEACQETYDTYLACRNPADRQLNFPSFKPGDAIGRWAIEQSRNRPLDALHETLMSLQSDWVHRYGTGLINAAAAEAMTTDPDSTLAQLKDYMVSGGFISETGGWVLNLEPERYRGNPVYQRFLAMTRADELTSFDLQRTEQWLAAVGKTYGHDKLYKVLRKLPGRDKAPAGDARRRLLVNLEYSLTDRPPVVGVYERPRMQPLLPGAFDADRFGLADEDYVVFSDELLRKRLDEQANEQPGEQGAAQDDKSLVQQFHLERLGTTCADFNNARRLACGRNGKQVLMTVLDGSCAPQGLALASALGETRMKFEVPCQAGSVWFACEEQGNCNRLDEAAVAKVLESEDILAWYAIADTRDIKAIDAYLKKYPLSHYRNEARGLRQELLEEDVENWAWIDHKLSRGQYDADDREALETYLHDHPDGRYNKKAATLLSRLDRAQQEAEYNTILGSKEARPYQDFIDKYPQSHLRQAAENKLAEIARQEQEAFWEKTSGVGTREAYEAFLDKYPSGSNARKAEQALEGIYASELSAEWEAVVATKDMGKIRAYMDAHRKSPIRHQFRETLKALDKEAWLAIKENATETALRAYLEDFPKGKYTRLVKLRLRKFNKQAQIDFWNSIKDGGTREQYEAYLEKYPRGKYSRIAKQKLKNMGG